MTPRKPGSKLFKWTSAEKRLIVSLRLQHPNQPWETVTTMFNQESPGPGRSFWSLKNKFHELRREEPALIEEIQNTALQVEPSDAQSSTMQQTPQQVINSDPSILQASADSAHSLPGVFDARHYFRSIMGRDVTPAEMRQLAISAATGQLVPFFQQYLVPNDDAYY